MQWVDMPTATDTVIVCSPKDRDNDDGAIWCIPHSQTHTTISAKHSEKERECDRPTDRTEPTNQLKQRAFRYFASFRNETKSSSTTKIYHYNASRTLCQAFHTGVVSLFPYIFFRFTPLLWPCRSAAWKAWVFVVAFAFAFVMLAWARAWAWTLCYI